MNYVDKRSILHLVQFVFNSYINEDYKNLLLEKYKRLKNFDEFLNSFVEDIYYIYKKDSDKLNFYLQYVSSNFLNNKDIEILKEEVVNKLEINSSCSEFSIEENHKMIEKSLSFICQKLNELNVDYYVTGSIPLYVKVGNGFKRFHSDIDIMINEKDIIYLEDIFKSSDYVLMDNRFNSHKFYDERENRVRGGHDFLAQCKDSDFSIGFYEFSKYDDGSLIKKDYFSSIEDNEICNYVYNNIYTKEYFDSFYSKDCIEFNGYKFKYFNFEGLYLYKSKNLFNEGRNKDFYDIKFMESNYNLDMTKINGLKSVFDNSTSYKKERIEKK